MGEMIDIQQLPQCLIVFGLSRYSF